MELLICHLKLDVHILVLNLLEVSRVSLLMNIELSCDIESFVGKEITISSTSSMKE